MRNLFIAAVSLLAISAFAPNPTLAAKKTNINPFQLVSLAENGAFTDIPGYEELAIAARVGEVTGKDIVEAAIASNRLPEELINDSSFIAAVDSQLDALKVGGE